MNLRPATPADEADLFAVYIDTRDDLAMLPPDVLEPLLRQQFAARDAAWNAAHPRATTEVVVVDDTVVGRWQVDRNGDVWTLVDVALRHDARGRGLGTALLTSLLAEADAAGVTVELHALRGSAAEQWYLRHGFSPTDHGDEVHTHLTR